MNIRFALFLIAFCGALHWRLLPSRNYKMIPKALAQRAIAINATTVRTVTTVAPRTVRPVRAARTLAPTTVRPVSASGVPTIVLGDIIRQLKPKFLDQTGPFKRFHTCAVVGSHDSVKKFKLGRYIDKHDAVFRSNVAKVKGFEEYIGRKTTVRSYNPSMSVKALPSDFELSIKTIDPQKSYDKALGTWKERIKTTGGEHFISDPIMVEMCNLLMYIALTNDFSAFETFLASPNHWNPRKLKRFSPHHCSTGTQNLFNALMMCDTLSIVGYTGCDGFTDEWGQEHYWESRFKENEKLVKKRYAIGQTKLIHLLTKEEPYTCAPVLYDKACESLASFGLNKIDTCAVVGGSGILKGAGLGTEIDSHDKVIRVNLSPVVGYETDVGKRTDIRIINYPAFGVFFVRPTLDQKQKLLDSIDSNTAAKIISPHALRNRIPWSSQFRNKCIGMFNRSLLSEHKTERKRKYEPTMGFEAIMRAYHSCGKIHIYGISDPATSGASYHYYDVRDKAKESWKDKFETNWDHYKAHNFKMEHDFLVKLHTINIIEKQLVPSKTALWKTGLHTPLAYAE